MKKTIILLLASLLATANSMAQLENAKWIVCQQDKKASLPTLKGTFTLEKKSKDVVLRATALGAYDVTINGKCVSKHELKPGWTDFRKEVTFQEMDISDAVRKGSNEIMVQLSHGWWTGGITRNAYGTDQPLCFKAEVVADGQIIEQTDEEWVWSKDGPLLLGDIYLGETYDARRKPKDWQLVTTQEQINISVIPFEGPEVRVRDKKLWRHPIRTEIYSKTKNTGTTFGQIIVDREVGDKPFTLRKGETAVVDMGQNMVGWILFDAKAKSGTEITFLHGEMLNYNGDKGRLDNGPGGSIWTYNLRDAKATVKYTFNGDKKGEHYRPRHTFMGFRYVSITATDDVEIRSLVGQVVGSEIEEWGEFECSDPNVNQLYSNIWWGQRGNFLSVPTDCPQRDERLGWTGDTQIFSRTALYQSDSKDFYRKWMRDMRNTQREDGAYPDIAPWSNFWGFGTAAWGDAGVIVPWNVYDMTGDKTILEENYASMQKWMEWLATQKEIENGKIYTHIGAGTATCDWLAYDELDKRFVSVAYYAYVAQLMDSVARVLGKSDDMNHYRQLYGNIREEFQQRYVDQDGNLNRTTQTAYLLALRLGLLEESDRKKACDALRKKIEDNGYRLSTGFVGTGMLNTTLSILGMDDLAYALLLQRKNPSWLYSVDQGATTIWERWDSYTKEEGFNKHPWNMNSFNHYAYGAVAEWMYAYIGGIRPGKPGFEHVILAPRVDNRPDNHPTLAEMPRMTWARTKINTPRGRITSEWRLKDNHYEYRFKVPKGMKYTIDIPNLKKGDIVKVTN